MTDFQTMMNLTGETAITPAIIAGLIVMFLIFLVIAVIFYVYYALAWHTIAKKLKHKKPWLAWIPIANCAMILQLGKFNWKWIFLVLLPIFGWIALGVMIIISMWRIYEKRNYPGWLSLTMVISTIPVISYFAIVADAVIIGLVAWKDRR